MRKWLLTVFCLLLAVSSWSQDHADPTLLTIDGKAVTRSEFVYSYHRNTDMNDAEPLSVSDYLDHFIDYKLKLAAALDAGYTLQPLQTERRAEAVETLNGTEAEYCYRQACKSAGAADMLRLSQILLRVDTRATEVEVSRVRQRMDSVSRALSNGADFADLARRLSADASAANGGDLGWVGPDQLLAEVEREAYSLRVGETSRPFLTPAGWHVVRVLDRKPATDAAVRQWFLTPRTLRLDQAPLAGDDLQLAREYDEGLLVSQITQQTIYNGPQPSEKDLKRYFKKNKKRYGKKLKKRDFPQYRDLVLSDYMQLQEQKWVVELRHQHKVKIYKSVLRTIE